MAAETCFLRMLFLLKPRRFFSFKLKPSFVQNINSSLRVSFTITRYVSCELFTQLHPEGPATLALILIHHTST